MLSSKEEQHANALADLVREGSMSWADAVKDFRAEFSVSLTYCRLFGIDKLLQQAALKGRLASTNHPD